MCFPADAPSSWWLATVPRRWTRWCVYRAVFAAVPMGGRAKKLREAGRADARAATSLAIDPARLALLFQTAGELPLVPCCLSPLSCAPFFNSCCLRNNRRSSSGEPQIFSFSEESAAGILACSVVLELCPGSLWKRRASF